MPEPPTVHTVGHSARPAAALVALLRAAGVAAVADVRRWPRSARHPQFNGAALRDALEAAGIAYHHLGADLGGYRDGGYEAHMETAAFARGLDALARLARERATAFLCAEREPWACHRRFIAGALQRRGWRVVHLLDPGQTVEGAPQGELPLWTPAAGGRGGRRSLAPG